MAGEFFNIPLSALALPHNIIRKACAVPKSGTPSTSLTNTSSAGRRPCAVHRPQRHLVGYPSIELVRPVIVTHLKRRTGGQNPGRYPATAHPRIRANTSTTRISPPNESRSRIHLRNATFTGCRRKRHQPGPSGSARTALKRADKTWQKPQPPQPPSPPSPGVTDSPTCPASVASSRAEYGLSRGNGVTYAPNGETHCIADVSSPRLSERRSAQAGYTNHSSMAFTLSGVNGGNRCSIATSGGDISIDLA